MTPWGRDQLISSQVASLTVPIYLSKAPKHYYLHTYSPCRARAAGPAKRARAQLSRPRRQQVRDD